MIFVTVGTHEQQFNRLVKKVDELKLNEFISDDVIIQTGYSTYEPKHCKWQKLFSYQEMIQNVKQARIVITHGGPSSFIMPLQEGKIPIVVPRLLEFEEHVNNHQLDFASEVERRQQNIILVNDVDNLQEVIMNYETYISQMKTGVESNNIVFNKKLETLVSKVIATK